MINHQAEHSSTTSSAQPSRLAIIDALRGIAALAVFFSHSLEGISPALQDFIYTQFDLGHCGVIIFFLCSGFVIPISLERQNSLKRFWIKRICRLYPLYWFTILLSILLTYYAVGGSFSSFWELHGPQILANLTML